MKIKNLMLDCNIYPNLKGFDYMIMAVEIVKKDGKVPIVEGVYKKIARIYQVSYISVERDLRYVVEKITMKTLAKYGINRSVTLKELIYYFAFMEN